MYYCPECSSDNIFLESDSEVKQFDEWSWQDVSLWKCEDCGCEFEKIEHTVVELEILKSGKGYEE